MKTNKKGQVSFSNAPNLVIALVIMGLVSAAGVIALVAFRNGSTDATANTTITNTITSISNFSAQLGTVGTMLGVGLLVAIVLAIFAFGGRGRGGGL